MPHIDVAMRRSVRRGLASYVVDSALGPRGVMEEANGVRNTFSSWDNCMAKVYCKWPVIVGIIVVSLILLSILWCIIRCACCGMSCCCSCFSFLKCCDCCGGCCDGRRDRPHKHLDDIPAAYPPHQGYQPHAPMMGGGLGAPSANAPPQFAQFDVGKSASSQPLNEDALPAMPSWEAASKKHVLEEEKDAVELGELDPATGQRLPLMAGAAGAGVSSPTTPSNEYAAGPFGQNQNGFNQNGGGYRGTPSPGPAMMGGRGYGPGQNGMGNYGPLRGASPGPGMMGGRGYGPGQNGMDNYGQPLRNASPGPGMMGGRYGPGPNGMGNNGSPHRGASPGPNGFVNAAVGGYGQPQGQYPNDRQQFSPQSGRQYSDSARGMNPGRQYSPAPQDGFQQDGFHRTDSPHGTFGGARSPPPTHNTGFDFGIDNQQQYSQRPSPPPQQPSYGSAQGRSYSPSPNLQQRGPGAGYGSTAPPSYATRTPPPQEQTYQAYVPPSDQGHRGPPQGRGGRGQEPEHWDPVQQ